MPHQLKAQSPEQRPRQVFWTLRRRMFAQVFAAVLPLIALSIYQMRLVGTIVTEMNALLSASQLSLQATRSYRNFLDGVTDAVDTGTLGPKAVDAIVAAEVRELANRSERIGNTFARVRDGAQLVEQAGATMREVIADVRQRAADLDAAVGQFKLTGTEAKVPRRAQRAPRPAAAIAANRPLEATGKLLARRQAG